MSRRASRKAEKERQRKIRMGDWEEATDSREDEDSTSGSFIEKDSTERKKEVSAVNSPPDVIDCIGKNSAT